MASTCWCDARRSRTGNLQANASYIFVSDSDSRMVTAGRNFHSPPKSESHGDWQRRGLSVDGSARRASTHQQALRCWRVRGFREHFPAADSEVAVRGGTGARQRCAPVRDPGSVLRGTVGHCRVGADEPHRWAVLAGAGDDHADLGCEPECVAPVARAARDAERRVSDSKGTNRQKGKDIATASKLCTVKRIGTGVAAEIHWVMMNKNASLLGCRAQVQMRGIKSR